MAIVFMMNEEIARGMVCFFHQKKHSYLIYFLKAITRDSISRSSPVSAVAGGDDTTRPGRQGFICIYILRNCTLSIMLFLKFFFWLILIHRAQVTTINWLHLHQAKFLRLCTNQLKRLE
jgi:hypothetical protein